MLSATFRRWRALRPRDRVAFAVLAATTLLVGLGLAGRWWPDPWPAGAVLRTPGDAWPLAFSPDSRTFLTFGKGGITPWDVASGRRGESWPVGVGESVVSGAFSPDGKTFAAAIFNPTRTFSITLHDATTGRIRSTRDTGSPDLYHLGFTADGRSLRGFLGHNPHLEEVVTWDASTGEETSRRPLTPPTRAGITAISRDGRTLAINAPRATTVQLWDLDSDRALGSLANPATTDAVSWGGMGFSEDGRTLAVGREGGTIELWDVPNRRIVKAIPAHGGEFTSTMIRFSPDGKTLASDGHRWGPKSTVRAILDDLRRQFGSNPIDDSEVVALDIAAGRRLARAADSTHPIYSPDGRTLATRDKDSSVKLRSLPEPSR